MRNSFITPIFNDRVAWRPFTQRNSGTDWIQSRAGDTNAVMFLRVRWKMHLSPLQVSTTSNSRVLYVWRSLQELFYLLVELVVQHLVKSELFQPWNIFPKSSSVIIYKSSSGDLEKEGNHNTFLIFTAIPLLNTSENSCLR